MDEEVRVLFVRGGRDDAARAASLLEAADDRFVVEPVERAEAALDRDLAGVDCVVSGYALPGEDGLALLRSVRNRDSDLPFVLYTDSGSEAVASEAISAGVTDYLHEDEDTERFEVLANRVRTAVEAYRSRQELAESRKRLSLLVEQSPIGVIEWDENFDFRRMNDAATAILGYTGEELQGRTWERIVPESDLPAVRSVVQDLLANQGGFHSVNENVRKDGERITCEWHNRVITDDESETVAILSQFQDVTEREERERALRESEARYQSMTEDVLDTSEVGTIVTDADLEVVWLNSAVETFFGVDGDALLGADYREAVDAVKPAVADPERFARRVKGACRSNEGTEQFECHVLPGEDRTERWLSHWSQPVECGLYAGGRIGHYTDITDQKKRTQQLDAMDRVLRHNLHNAMTVVLGSAETIAEEADDEVAELAEVIHDSGEELLAVTRKQRDIVELLSAPPDVATVDVSRLVEAAVADVAGAHPAADIDADVPGNVTARAIPELEVAVGELLDNAVAHAEDPEPTISVAVESVEDRVHIRVADTGPPIPDAELAILRGEGEGGPLFHGSGMGLWLVNWVVSYSDGAVTYAENEPRGNVVTIDLARAE